jgi:signal transduction histidine kinase
VFWLIYFIYNVFDELEHTGIRNSLISSVIFTGEIFILVYLNIKFFIPVFFYKRKLFLYSIALSFSMTLEFYFHEIIDEFLLENTFSSEEQYVERYEGVFFWLPYELIQMFITVSGISSIWYLFDRIRIKENLDRIQQEQMIANMKFLKAQVNPHFLFNILNNIHFLIKKDTEQASETLLMLSDLLRYQLYETDVQWVTIEQEVDYIKNYIKLEKTRIGKELLTLDVDINFEEATIQIAPFLILPLIENAFKYSASKGRSSIDLRLNVTKDEFKLRIENSLTSLNRSGESIKGIGLDNLKKRLELLYPNGYNYSSGVERGNYVAYLNIKL